MNLYDMNNDNIIMNIDGKDIEMKHPICFGKTHNMWLVSRCGKVWSKYFKKRIYGRKVPYGSGKKHYMQFCISTDIGFWEDGSGRLSRGGGPDHWVGRHAREIMLHKMIMDTWAPLYDNPPECITWEEWEIVRRDLPSVYNHISKTICIDHIDDDPTNNHLDNLRRVTNWDNQNTRKAKGI